MAERVALNTKAPDFTLDNHQGQAISLSDFQGQTIFLVFNRGFI